MCEILKNSSICLYRDSILVMSKGNCEIIQLGDVVDKVVNHQLTIDNIVDSFKIAGKIIGPNPISNHLDEKIQTEDKYILRLVRGAQEPITDSSILIGIINIFTCPGGNLKSLQIEIYDNSADGTKDRHQAEIDQVLVPNYLSAYYAPTKGYVVEFDIMSTERVFAKI